MNKYLLLIWIKKIAGADIKEMSDLTYMEAYKRGMFSICDEIPKIKKPIIAAVSVIFYYYLNKFYLNNRVML